MGLVLPCACHCMYVVRKTKWIWKEVSERKSRSHLSSGPHFSSVWWDWSIFQVKLIVLPLCFFSQSCEGWRKMASTSGRDHYLPQVRRSPILQLPYFRNAPKFDFACLPYFRNAPKFDFSCLPYFRNAPKSDFTWLPQLWFALIFLHNFCYLEISFLVLWFAPKPKAFQTLLTGPPRQEYRWG